MGAQNKRRRHGWRGSLRTPAVQCVHHLKLGEFALLTLSKKSSSPPLFPLTPLYFFHGIYPYQYSCPIIHFLKPSDYHGGGGDGQFASVVTSCREGNGTPLQDSCLENPMDGGAWKAAVHGVAKTRTRLSDFTLTFHFPALEKEMATHSSVLAWRIPGTGEPGGLPSMGLHSVGHD